MPDNLLVLFVILPTLLLMITAITSWFQPGLRPKKVITMSKISSYLGIILALVSSYFVYQNGLLESNTIGFMDLGFSLRLDALSVLIFSMINLISFIVFKYSFNYLDGDKGQGVFTGRIAATVASVQLLVLSGNLGLLFLAWVLTSFSLHRLLTFYPERRGAIVAARKKFIAARVSDAFLFLACVLLYNHFGSGNLEIIATGMKSLSFSDIPLLIEISALCIALAAILKSALFPTHGWLVEVMETPTPVSALLHAGLLNAGPFLVIRMAFVMNGATYAPIVLILLGGFTALFASISYLTQTSVKTALGYSSISHMGFSLLMCGFGVYSAAVLHLVAHSFYKAHAFLSSGSVIDVLKATRISLPQRKVKLIRVFSSVILALIVFSCLAFIWGIDPVNEFALLIIGGVIVLGLSVFIANIFGSLSTLSGLVRASLLTALVAIAFFSLEAGMSHLLQTQIPFISQPSFVVTMLIITILFVFTLVIFIQMFAPLISNSARWRKLAIHVRNGLYANVLFDRLVGALYIKSPKNERESSVANQ
jgi:NAD(P)H-quinone oxidoreductase subunit 5